MKFTISIIFILTFFASCQKSSNQSLKSVFGTIKGQSSKQVQIDDQCKKLVIEGKSLLGETLVAEEFSTLNTENFEITRDEFNKLPTKKQKELYKKLKPLKMYVEETINQIDNRLNLASTSIWGYLTDSETDQFKKVRDNLKTCFK